MSSVSPDSGRPELPLDQERALWQSVERIIDDAYLRVAEDVGPVVLDNVLDEIKFIETRKNELIEDYAEPAEANLERYANIASGVEHDLATFTQAGERGYATVEDFLAHQQMLDELYPKSTGQGVTCNVWPSIAPLEDRLEDVEHMDKRGMTLPYIVPLENPNNPNNE